MDVQTQNSPLHRRGVGDEVPGNRLFPVFLKLEHLRLLIVGGGNVGLEKLNAVLKNSPSTQVTLVAGQVSAAIKQLATEFPNLLIQEKLYQPEDLIDQQLVIVATNDRELSAQIGQDARQRNLLVNVADTPDLCDFYLGSIVKKGDLKIAVSTNGKSPTLAKRLRQVFEESLPEQTQTLMDNLQAIRAQLSGDFTDKVNRLNEITASLLPPTIQPEPRKPAEPLNIAALNEKYRDLTVEQRILELYKDFPTEEILLTSSFAANSVVLLHLFARLTESKQPIHFIDTTYHFSETLAYKQLLTQQYHLDVVDVKPAVWKNLFTREYELWKKDPDLCCTVNKNEPLEAIKPNYRVWVSGLMRSQNAFREQLNLFEEKQGILKFHPILDMTPEQRDQYVLSHDLPLHPLTLEGYGSIGCTHCTVKGTGREGRWFGSAKTECGLHI